MYSININTLTDNHFYPNISKVIKKYWSLPAINESLKVIFDCQWVTAFRQNKGIDIGRQILKLKPGKDFLCLKNLRSLCCKQVRETAAIKSQQTKKIYKIFHNVNCASRYVIYLMEGILCNKQNVGKAGISFNIRLNNHSKDVNKVDAIMACKHFQQESRNFNKCAKFTVIDQLTNNSKSKKTLTWWLTKR